MSGISRNVSPERNTPPMNLDQMLRDLAAETPEMPADFHARWTLAVRQEAARGSDEKKMPAAVRRNRWTRILATAAVFVFLIGGTLLTRDSLRPGVRQEPEKLTAFSRGVSFTQIRGADPAAPTGALTAEPAAAPAAWEMETDADLDAGIPIPAATAGNGLISAIPSVATSGSEPEKTVEWETEEAMEASMDEAAVEEEPMEEAAAEEMEEESAKETSEKAAEKAAKEEYTEEEESAAEAREEASKNSFGQEVGLFLEDMGWFLLAALPYLAGAGVLIAGGWLYRRAKRKNQ